MEARTVETTTAYCHLADRSTIAGQVDDEHAWVDVGRASVFPASPQQARRIAQEFLNLATAWEARLIHDQRDAFSPADDQADAADTGMYDQAVS